MLRTRCSTRTATTLAIAALTLSLTTAVQAEIDPAKLAKKRAKALANGKIYGPEGRQSCDANGICENRYTFGSASESYGCTTTTPPDLTDQSADDLLALDGDIGLVYEELELLVKKFETTVGSEQTRDSTEMEGEDTEDDYLPVYDSSAPVETCKTRRWDVEFRRRDEQTTLLIQQDLASPSKVLKSKQPCSVTIAFTDRSGRERHSSTFSCTADHEARVWKARVSDDFLEGVDLADRNVTLSVDSGGRSERLTAKRFGSRYRYTLADFVSTHSTTSDR